METQHETDLQSRAQSYKSTDAGKPPTATALIAQNRASQGWYIFEEGFNQLGMCSYCGTQSVGASTEDAINHTYFSDYNLMTVDSGHLCAACAYCMSQREVKQGHWIATANRYKRVPTGDLLDVFTDLRAGQHETPLAVHVTSSPIRSSHAYLWTPLNVTDSPLTVAYDRQKVRIADWKRFSELVRAVEDLRLHGFTFDEIQSGEPRVRNLREIGRESYQDCDEVIDPHRRTARLELALTLSRGADDQPRNDITEPHDPLA
jgi:hypothetical protein